MSFPATFYALLRNQMYLTVTGATTETFSDKLIYDTEVYRNTMPAGYIGRAWGSSLVFPAVSPASPESRDDNFTQTAPKPLQKTRTLITWTDGASNVCGECWADQFIGISSQPPHFVQ